MTNAVESESMEPMETTQASLAALLGQSIYSRLPGYDDTNHAECLCVDPAARNEIECPFKTTNVLACSRIEL